MFFRVMPKMRPHVVYMVSRIKHFYLPKLSSSTLCDDFQSSKYWSVTASDSQAIFHYFSVFLNIVQIGQMILLNDIVIDNLLWCYYCYSMGNQLKLFLNSDVNMDYCMVGIIENIAVTNKIWYWGS